MPILKTFDWEIFISYGWADNPENQGSRAWARSLKDHLEDRLGMDFVSAPRIYFDMRARREGTLDVELRKAVQRSALMVFVVSPGSYRKNSYCQMEVVEFWDYARPLAAGSAEPLAPENRIFKVTQAPVQERGAEPEPLRDHPAYQLFDHKTGLSEKFEELDEDARLERENFYFHLVETLKRVQEFEDCQPSGLRVFLGPVYSKLYREHFQSLRRELLVSGHQVVSATPLPGDIETEEGLRGRLERAHEGVRLAVHFIPPQQQQQSPGWALNFPAHQIAYSNVKSEGQELFSVYAWQDPMVSQFDEQCLSELVKVAAVTGNQTPKFMVFQDLKTEVKKRLRETRRQRVGKINPFDVVIEHWDVDSALAHTIREYLDKQGWIVQFANPTERTSRSNEVADSNSTLFYPKAKRFIIIYGQANDRWVNNVCYAMDPFITENGAGLVVLMPPPEPPPSKKYYRHPADVPFETVNCIDGTILNALDKWLGPPPGSRGGGQ